MKIGIITMHKVRNFGSALQAYALQQKVKQLGYENELIDYVYPKVIKTTISLKSVFRCIDAFLRNMVMGFPQYRQSKKFDEFYSKNFQLSSVLVDESSIGQLPVYEGYITGSDQVWNPRFAGKDTNFMLAFAPDDKPKISYASSIATTNVDQELQELYAKYLNRYDALSVRETSGVKIIRELIGKDANVCCDPTLLLDSKDWDRLAQQSKLNIKYKYVLVYPLTYMHNPYPKLYDIVSMVQKALGCKAIFLEGRKEDILHPNSKLIKSAGPADFVYLIKNAEFVITTSFHGTAFSMIYNKPMFGIVDKSNTKDSRLQSLLEEYHAEDCILDLNEGIIYSREQLLALKGNNKFGRNFIVSSQSFLEGKLKDNFNKSN